MASETAPADTPRTRRVRLVAILALAAVVGVAAWATQRSGKVSDSPERVFDYVRDRTLDGDGEAMWREMTARARQDYVKFLQILDRPGGAQGTSYDPAEWRKRVGISAEEVRNLPPEKVMARENLALAEEFFRGARVFSADRLDDGTAYLRITLRSGHERFWLVRRTDGVWKIDNLWATMGPDGNLIPRSGESPPEPRAGGAPPPGTGDRARSQR